MNEVIRNRQVNYKKKIDPETIQEGETGLNSLRDAIERAKIIVENLKGNPGWEALKKTYSEKLEAINESLDNFKDLPDKHRDYLLADRKFSGEFLNLVESMEQKIELLEGQYAEDKAKLNERKQRLRATEPAGSGQF